MSVATMLLLVRRCENADQVLRLRYESSLSLNNVCIYRENIGQTVRSFPVGWEGGEVGHGENWVSSIIVPSQTAMLGQTR